MSVLNRKLGRELLAVKGLLAAIVSMIVVGVSCFVAMVSWYFNLEQSRRSYYAQCRMADFSVELKKAPLPAINRLNSIRGISELRPRITFLATADLEGVAKPLSGWVVSLPATPTPVINNIVLRRGSYFTDRRRNEVIVNDAFARAHHLRPGDRLHLILNNRLQELSVVGTAISSEFVYLLGPGGLVPDPESFGVFYVKQRFAEEIFDFQGACNQVVGLLDPSCRERPQRILDEVEDQLRDYGVVTTTPRSRQSSHIFLINEIDGLRVTASVLPAVFLGVAALVLNMLMMRIAEQQRTVVGTLKAIGYSDRELLVHYLKFGVTVGLIGGALGVLIGYLLAGGIGSMYEQFFEFPRLVNQPYPGTMLAGVGISLFFSAAGTLRGVRSVMRLAPAEAMRPRPPKRGRRILIENWLWFWSRIDFRWHMVLRGIFRNRMRTAAAVAAAAVGASLILVTFQMRDAMNEMVSFHFDKVLLSDFELSFQQARDFGALYEAKHLPGVDYAEPVFAIGCTFQNGHIHKQGAITGIVQSARLTVPRDTSGNGVPVPDEGLLLTRKLAESLGIEAGETLRVEPVRGRRHPFDVLVMRVVDSYLGMSAYCDFHYLNRLMGEEESVTSVQLKVQPGERTAEAFYRQLKALPMIESVGAIRDNKEKMVEVLVESMLISVFVTIFFAGLVFFGSVLNASLISLSDRRQEIATFRVLGYLPGEVGSIFLRESLLLNLFGSILGLPLGYWLSVEMGKMYDTEIFRIPLVIHPMSCLLPVIFGVVFTLMAHVAVQRSINKMNWLEALNVKE